MKQKRIIGIVIATIILLATICMLFPSNTYAANTSYVLGITNIRESGYGYGVGGLKSDNTPTKKVWKIVSYNNNVISYDNAFYCIKAEHGFVDNTNNSNTDVSTIRKTYDTKFDMKQDPTSVITRLNAINTAVGDAAISNETYNKILWIMDNMYLPKAESAATDKEALAQAAGINSGNLLLTDDELEVVQQLAIWHYTNPTDTNYNTATTIYRNRTASQDSNYASLADIFDDPVANTQAGRVRQLQADAIYNYLVNTAEQHPQYLSEDVNTVPATLDKSNYTAVQENDRIIVGPLKVTIDTSRARNVDMVFKDESGNTIALTGDNKLLNANKEVVTSGNIADVVGQNFYISLPSDTTIKNVNFELKGSYPTTTATYYTTSQSTYLQEQPVVLVERGNKPISLTAQTALPSPIKIDLALRKFITSINSKGVEKEITNRIPTVDTSTIDSVIGGTAKYNHTKQPVSVKIGDIVTYTIRVYNEGKVDGYVSEITDHLPSYLEILQDSNSTTEAEKAAAEFNENFLWEVSADGRTIKTQVTAFDKTDTYSVLTGIQRENTLLQAFNGGTTLDYIDVKVKCKVKSTAEAGTKITNIADITKMQDASGNNVTIDRDSQVANVQLPEDSALPNYKDNEINSGISYIPGQQDDDDFEKLVIEVFDLALRKFITAINDQSVTTRIPVPTIKNGNIEYKHDKTPLEVQNGNIVTYTIRIFNEGDIDGYASEITDDLPEGLEFLPDNDLNKTYRWKMIDKNGNETTDLTKAVKVTTDYLSKGQEKTSGANLIKAFNKEAGITNSNPDYKDIKIAFKVIEPNTSDRILTNIAQISNDSDAEGNPIDDIDSIPGNDKMDEDDIDVEHVKLVYFDLALRKFITKVDNLDINNRYPKLTIDENGNIKYTHTKEPVEVENGNVVTYTIRVYNEGRMSGYATEVTDDLPEGLEFLPDNDLNKTYRWKMIDKDGKETNDVTKAVKITTDYLSKEQEKTTGANLIKAYDASAGITDSNPDYKDVKIAFKVTEPNTSDRILINTAEISEDSDKNGNPVDDIDSIPGNNKNGEDDIDIEKVKVKYFDLALKKWVTKVYTIENGKQTVTETGHTGDENPEPVVKVDLKSKKVKSVTVKFGYKIKVTNEGQIEGYAKEVKDYIPDGLKFVAEDNPTWKKVNDKEVVTDKLANTLLKPGESATVDIILTWENSEANLGVKVNVAEISKDYNKSNTPDIDSTPNNKKDGEDDIDDAPVILSIKTGQAKIYVVLTSIVLVTLAGGVFLIKKFVL